MLNTALGALLPMVVTFLLGFVAALRHDFGSKAASTLNRMVLQYAVPLALFAGTVMTSRAALGQDVPLAITLCVAIIGFYFVVFLISRFIFRTQVSTSALAALTASAPAVPFEGPAVLGDLLGRLSAIPIAAASLVINLTVVPITILLLSLDSTGRNPQTNTPVPGERILHRRLNHTSRCSLANSRRPSKNRSFGHRFSLSLSCSAVSAFLS
jgi:malonate transporter and related proteins